MPYEVEAFGSIIEIPDDVSHEEAYKQIMANEHKINPNYKKPLRDKVNAWAQKNLAVDIGNAYGREDPKPMDKTDPDYDEFMDPASYKSNAPEGMNGLVGNVLTGAKQTGRMASATVNAGLNDRSAVETLAKESRISAEKNTPLEQRVLQGDLKQIDREQGAFGQIGDTLKAAGKNPMGTGQMVAEQLPNTAVSLASGYAGFKVGATAGAAFGPVGAAIGGSLGFVSGMFLGNVLLESGSKAIEKASDEDGFTPQDRDAALREGAIKAAVITGVDAATFKLGSVVFNKLGSGAINAGARAEAKVLIDAGVDATSLAAINTALKASPELFKAAKTAGERASMQALSVGRKSAMLGTGAALETVGEFAGEAGGEYAATGKADYVDATIEALSSATMSAAQTAYNYNKVASGNDLSHEGIQKAASSINDMNTKAGVDDIQKAATLDEAIDAAKETVSSKPVTNDDILRTVDPTLADIQAATGEKEYSKLVADAESMKINNPDTWTDADERMLTLAKSNLRSMKGAQKNETQTATIDTGQAEAAQVLDIVLPDNSSVKAQWKIVDADQIAASMKEDVNQPRDRTRAASDVQIKSIANAPDYRRLSDSPVMDVGAPVVDKDGRIVAGNGRFAGLSQAYEQGTATEYMNQLREDAARKGLSIEGIAKPVLVRQLLEPVDTRKMAIASNSGTTLQMSALEQANLDAERMKGIENLDVNDLGDIALTPRNLTQLKDSLGNYVGTELGAMVDKGGQLSQEGVRRVRNAMLAKAYGNTPALEKIVESTDTDMRNVLGALTRSAGTVAQVRSSAPKELDITDNLLNAVDTLSQIKSKGQALDSYLAQDNIFGDNIDSDSKEILQFLNDNIRSQKKLTEFIKEVYSKIGSIDQSTDDIFGDNTLPTKAELIQNAKQTTGKQTAEQADIFSSPNEQESKAKASNAGSGTESKPTQSLTQTASWVIKNKSTGEILFETFDKAKVDALNTSKYEAVPIYNHLAGLNKDAPKPTQGLKDVRISKLEKHLKDNGYDFTIEPASVRDIDALDSTKKARKELAEKQAKLFKKKVVFIKADGPFSINGVMVPGIADTIFVDIRTAKPFNSVMAHELSHWMEQEKPEVYKAMLKSLKKVVVEDATEGYAEKYGIEGATKSELNKEIAADIMGDNFSNESFWNKVAEANPQAFKDIAAAIIKWLKGVIVKAKANGMGSEQWVKDATKAQDIIAKAVAQYTESEATQASAESKPKFSNAEIENTLIAQHNLTVRNLIHADRMGGLAAPSIAVTDKAHPLTGFGEITLLSHKDLIDPKNGTKIFGSDIYSPRYPSLSYDFSGKAIKNLNSLLADGVKNTGDSEFYNDSLERDPFRELLHSSAAMYQFLTEQGKEPNIAYVTPNELPDARLMRFVDEKKDSFDLSNDDDFKNVVKEVSSDKSDRENIDDKTLGYITRDYANQVVAHREAIRNAGKVDRQSTNSNMFRQISDEGLRNKFDDFLVNLVDKSGPKERIFKGYTNAGNRQYMPHDLDTVIKILKKDLRGGENFKYGLGSIRAKYSPQFKSIEQIRKSKGMLMNSESFKQVKKEVQAGLDDLNESLSSYGTFSGFDNVETMLSDAAKRGISLALKDNGFENVPDSIKLDIQNFLNKLKDMPTEYFEAKILRAVGLGEFSTAIIPDDATPQVEAILKKNGIEDIRKYKSGDTEDRVKQINKVTHVMFSRVTVDGIERPTTNSEGKPINNPVNFWKWFGDSEARQWPKSSRGDRAMAPPLVLYHGTKGDFNEFVVGSPGTNSTVFGPWETKRAGMFFTQDKKFAESFATQGDSTQGANILPVYLKVENAIDLTEGFTDDTIIDALAEKGVNPRLMRNISADQIWGMFDEEDDGSFFVSKLKELGYDGAIIVEPNTATDESAESWVVFSPNQIKSAIGNNGDYSLTNNDIRFSRAPKLYSKLEQALEAANDKIFSTGPQVKLWLQSNAGKLGIKKDEIYWSGIDNWLDAQGKVSKQQVVEFVRNNGVRVEDVTLSSDTPVSFNWEEVESSDSGFTETYEASFKSNDEYESVENMGIAYAPGADGWWAFYRGDTVAEDLNTREQAEAAAIDAARPDMSKKESAANSPKHNNDKLTLPGGTDYKELVVTVPTIEPHNADDSTHFGDAGQGKQIGWLRMDTRDGGLFIEELQSQRAQQGRSKGFQREVNQWFIAYKNGPAIGDSYNSEQEAQAELVDTFGRRDDMEIRPGERDRSTKMVGVPPAPFVSDANNKATNAYITLLMKKALIEAVSNDHASVSWTTGDQQADRYDLSKQISRVNYFPDNHTLMAFDSDSAVVLNKKNVPENEIQDYIGKDAAQKLLGSAPRKGTTGRLIKSLEGVELKAGGEWAQSMYGNEQGLNLQGKPSLMSQAANDIFKHVGSGKVESIDGQPGFYVTLEMKSKDLPLFSREEPQQPKKFNPNEDIPETRFRKSQRIGQDKFNRFTVVKEFLAKQKDIVLSENADVYKAEERYHAKVANQLEDFREGTRNPLVEKIAKAGFKLDQVEEYLLNNHAQEANAQNRKLTGKEDSTAYGISDQEAKDYLAKVPKELAKLADEVQAITKTAQQLRLNNGIENQERVDAMNGAYKYYVPVRGDAESQEKQSKGQGTGKGYGIKYKGKRRLGHEARNEAVIDNIFQDYERAVIQVEKNRVAKSLALMAAEIQMPELISIDQPVKRKVLQNQKAYGVLVKGELVDVFQTQEAANQNRQLLVATDKKLTLSDITIAPITDQRLIYSASPMLADNEVLVYMDGHELRLQINDDLLARAYKNMGTEALGSILSVGRAMNGWMSKVYTGYNPEFIFTNIQRDFQSGIINLTGEQGALIAAKAVANYPKSFSALLKYAATGKSTEWIDAYRDNGGNTGAAYLPDLERLGTEVRKEYASYQGVMANLKEKDAANALRAAGRKTFNATLKYIEYMNQAGENAFRLATFKAMIDSGESVKEAASMAKNVTVNFNRKGEIGAEMNALYLFFNASVQGTSAVSHALFKGRHKYQAWGLAGSMMTLGYMMASTLGGFDDEDKYDEISDQTKSRNLIMSYGDGYTKIPVPYGHGFFYNAGRMFAEAQRKGELGKMPYQLTALATEEFSPFNVASTEDGEFNSKKVIYGIFPSVPAIPLEIATNFSRFTGRELYPEKDWYKSEPDNEKMWRGTKGTVYDITAQYLASIGVAEISPETLKHITRAATGGTGAFVDSIISAAMLKKEGAELDTREIPFVRKMYGEATIQDKRARFGKIADEARIAKEKFNAAKRDNDLSSLEKVMKDKSELLYLNEFANKTSEVIKIFRDEQDSIKLSDNYTTAEKRLKIKELEREEEGFYKMFFDEYKKIDRSKLN